MSDPIALPPSSATADSTADSRAPFVAPAVSDLGKLQGLTQLGTSSL